MEVNHSTLVDKTVSQPVIQSANSLSLDSSIVDSSAATCILIGEGTLLAQCAKLLLENHFTITYIISEDIQVQRFATEANISVASSLQTLENILDQSSTDYLFSIINPRILPDRLLTKVKKRAINYHDGPLPKYAGLNATYWALLNNETNHGITWHSIAAGIDTGDILKQKQVAIDATDTSFTLNIKCFEAAYSAFEELVADLSQNAVVLTKQELSDRSYYGGNRKAPLGGIIHWCRGAESIERLCRASDFGFYPNSLGRPKVWINQTLFLVGTTQIEKRKSPKQVGTIISLTAESLTVATSSQDITLSQLSTLDGQPLSIDDFARENGLREGSVLPDPSLDTSLKIEKIDSEVARWQNYWVKKLSALQPTRLPFASRLPLSTTSATYQIQVPFSSSVQNFLSTYGDNAQGVQFLISAFVLYLARVTGTTQVQTGFTSEKLLETLAGLPDYFSSTVPLQASLNLEEDFENTYNAVVSELTKSQKAFTFAKDVVARYTQLRNQNECKENPLFPVVVALTQTTPETYTNLGRELTAWVSETQRSIHLVASASRFDVKSLERMASQVATLLENLIKDFHEPVARHSLLTDVERHVILEDWNATVHDYSSELCMHQLFEKQASCTPNAIAILFEDKQLTYAELNEKANQLAHLLQQKGAGPGVLIGLCMEKSLEMVIGVLGIQKAGGAYVPLEPTAPKDRLGLVLDDLKLSMLITQTKFQEIFDGQPFQVIPVDQNPAILLQPKTNPTSAVTSEDLAYIIYTSGSTGIPKGVVVRHRPAINLIEWVNQTFHMGPADRVLFVNSLGFDLSVYDIFGILAVGGSVRVASKSELQNPQQLLEILYHEPITLWNSAPATLSQIVPFSNAIPAPEKTSLRLAFLSGDWIPLALPGWITSNFINAEVISLGGATEATVWSNYFRIPKQLDEQWVSIPYGYPIQNARYHILDAYLQPVPVGVAAELFIGGECLADGYLNRPELNQEKFIPDPIQTNPKARLYRTGDLARYMPDGNMEFLGRKDHQVKIRGYRIELGEIEAVLTEHANVQDMIVVAQPDSSGNKRLIAYIVQKIAHATTTAEFRDYLKDKLPDYMIPSLFVFLDVMPLNASGKIDRKALPEPGLTEDVQKDYEPPRSPSEYLLAELWCSILQLPKISIHSNFFEIGGHSLLGVQLISRLRQKTGKNIPLTHLFANPTIAKFARFLDEKTDCSAWNSLVPIRTTGSRTPLFCVHPVSGGVEYVSKLAEYVGENQPLYGLQAIGLNRVDTPLECAYLMANHYVKLILEKQPEGPYQLAGYSVGGLIAYEIASRLRAMNKEVSTLILFDTYPARKHRISGYDHIGLKYIFQSWGNLLLDPDVAFAERIEVVQDMYKVQKDFFGMLSGHLGYRKRLAANPIIDRTDPVAENILRATWKAGRNYRQKPYDGKVVFIRAKDNAAKHLSNSDFGWKKYLTSDFQLYEVEGDHFSLFKDEESLKEIGSIVKAELN